jgi:hypothetical protein
MRTSHRVENTMKKSGVNGNGGVRRCVYGPSCGNSDELGASNGAGGGNDDSAEKLVATAGAGVGAASVVAEDAKEFAYPVSREG